MTLLRDLIDIPTSVGEGDFVVKAAEGADLHRYVVTDLLKVNFTAALDIVRHAVTSGSSAGRDRRPKEDGKLWRADRPLTPSQRIV